MYTVKTAYAYMSFPSLLQFRMFGTSINLLRHFGEEIPVRLAWISVRRKKKQYSEQK